MFYKTNSLELKLANNKNVIKEKVYLNAKLQENSDNHFIDSLLRYTFNVLVNIEVLLILLYMQSLS